LWGRILLIPVKFGLRFIRKVFYQKPYLSVTLYIIIIGTTYITKLQQAEQVYIYICNQLSSYIILIITRTCILFLRHEYKLYWDIYTYIHILYWGRRIPPYLYMVRLAPTIEPTGPRDFFAYHNVDRLLGMRIDLFSNTQ